VEEKKCLRLKVSDIYIVIVRYIRDPTHFYFYLQNGERRRKGGNGMVQEEVEVVEVQADTSTLSLWLGRVL
jgi:hypothetical protein